MILPIIKPRAGGKTTDLVTWVLGDLRSRVIIVADEQRASMLRELIVHTAARPVTREDRHVVDDAVIPFERRETIRGKKKAIAIDDLDNVLQRMFWNEIHAFTMTGPSHDGEGREVVDKDAVYAFVNQRAAEPERRQLSHGDLFYLVEDELYPVKPSDEVLHRLVRLLERVQAGEQGPPPLISKSGKIRKSDEVVTFSNGTTMPLDMVLMLGAARMSEEDLRNSLEGSGITDDASRPSPK